MSIDPRWAVIVADGDSDAAALERAMAARGRTARPRRVSRGAAAGHRRRPWRAARRGAGRAARPDGRRRRLAVPVRAGPPACRRRSVRAGPQRQGRERYRAVPPRRHRRGAVHIRLIGALGGPRPEHSVANLLLLGLPALDGLDVAIVTATSTIRRIGTAGGTGRLDIEGTPADHVSLFAIDSVVEGVRHRRPALPAASRAAATRTGPRPVQRAHRGIGQRQLRARASARHPYPTQAGDACMNVRRARRP